MSHKAIKTLWLVLARNETIGEREERVLLISCSTHSHTHKSSRHTIFRATNNYWVNQDRNSGEKRRKKLVGRRNRHDIRRTLASISQNCSSCSFCAEALRRKRAPLIQGESTRPWKLSTKHKSSYLNARNLSDKLDVQESVATGAIQRDTMRCNARRGSGRTRHSLSKCLMQKNEKLEEGDRNMRRRRGLN